MLFPFRPVLKRRRGRRGSAEPISQTPGAATSRCLTHPENIADLRFRTHPGGNKVRGTVLGDGHLTAMRRQPAYEERYAVRFSLLRAARGFLTIFGCSVALGYAVGLSFQPSPAAIAPSPVTVPRYTSMDVSPPQPALPVGTFQAGTLPTEAHPASTGGPPPWLAAPMPPRQPVPVSPPAPAPSGDADTDTEKSGPAGPAVPGTRFYVEIGASQDPAQTDGIIRDLRRRGYPVHAGSGGTGTLRVGGWLDRPTAERLARLLSAAGFETAVMTR